MAHDLDDQNVITTPSGEIIVLAPGKPRSLESHYGLLVQATREYYEEFLRMAQEACRTAGDQEDDGGREGVFNLTAVVDPELFIERQGGTGGFHDLPAGHPGTGG